jgi:hypothetical protein
MLQVYTCCPELPAFWDRQEEIKEPKLQNFMAS